MQFIDDSAVVEDQRAQFAVSEQPVDLLVTCEGAASKLERFQLRYDVGIFGTCDVLDIKTPAGNGEVSQ